MIRKIKQSGLTLTETTVVVAVAALLTALSMPAVRTFFGSMATSGDTRALISASLASARAIAAREQKYAGIRFQKAYDPRGPLYAPQYIIFIVYEEPRKMGNLTVGFRAVEGIQPIKLSDEVGVMDLRLGAVGDTTIGIDADILNDWQVMDTTSFSVVFSPSGKLVVHDVRVRNRDGRIEGTESATVSNDDIFNTRTKITRPVNPVGMFLQDDYSADGLKGEPSRSSFIIYETDKFKQAYSRGKAYSEYLQGLIPETVFINPYTGTIVNK